MSSAFATAAKPPAEPVTMRMTGAQMVIQALVDNGVDTIFGYPGGAVLPIYDAIFHQDKLQHILVRHEQAAGHAAEGYARSTGKVGVLLVTSGPGATNAITPLTDALLDSIPIICITGQVPTHLIGTDAFQEADTTGISRACTKHNYLVKRIQDLPRILHEAFHIAKTGRPGPVLVDIPKDIQFAEGDYFPPPKAEDQSYQPVRSAQADAIEAAVELMANAKKPIFYTGGGVINAGDEASRLLRELVRETGFPVTSTLMGLGAYPATDPQWMGMLGMHGTYEANMAMHQCDVMINIGARFDDRVTGKISEFSPNSKKIHVDVDSSSINKIIRVDVPIVADAADALRQMLACWRAKKYTAQPETKNWWKQIEEWRAKKCLSFRQNDSVIKPQYAIQRLYEKTRTHKDVIITTEVGQHQMWAAQHFGFDKPNKWLTSGGLGTMGYGFPAAIGAQMAHPEALVIDIAGEASILMNMQEMSTAVQYNLPVKIFVLNNQWMGMVRQWQQLIHGERYSHSYTDSLPDFVKLAEAYGGVGLRAERPDQLDSVIDQMLAVNDRPCIVDVCVDKTENCYPMIPSGAAHYDMILSPEEADRETSAEGLTMV